MSDRIPASQDPTRILILTFALAAVALVGLTVAAFSQLKRPRPAAAPTEPYTVEREPILLAPTAVELAARAPAAMVRTAPTAATAGRRREKPPVAPRKVIGTSLSEKLGACTDPMCGLPIE